MAPVGNSARQSASAVRMLGILLFIWNSSFPSFFVGGPEGTPSCALSVSIAGFTFFRNVFREILTIILFYFIYILFYFSNISFPAIYSAKKAPSSAGLGQGTVRMGF
jgi:hypothetical protein